MKKIKIFMISLMIVSVGQTPAMYKRSYTFTDQVKAQDAFKKSSVKPIEIHGVDTPDVSQQQSQAVTRPQLSLSEQVPQVVDSPQKNFTYNLIVRPKNQVASAAHELSIIPVKNQQTNQSNNKNSDALIENSNNQSLVVTSNKAQLQPIINNSSSPSFFQSFGIFNKPVSKNIDLSVVKQDEVGYSSNEPTQGPVFVENSSISKSIFAIPNHVQSDLNKPFDQQKNLVAGPSRIKNGDNQSLFDATNKAELQPVIATAEQLQSYLDSLSQATRLNFERMLLDTSVDRPFFWFNEDRSRAILINKDVVDAVLGLVRDLPEAQPRANLLVTNGPDINKETSPFSKPSQSIEIAQSSSGVQPQSLRIHENSVAPVEPTNQFLDQQSDVGEAVLGLVDNGPSAQGQANTSPEILDQLANKKTLPFSKPSLPKARKNPTRVKFDHKSIEEQKSQSLTIDENSIKQADEVVEQQGVTIKQNGKSAGAEMSKVNSFPRTPSNSNVIEQIDAAPTPQAKKGILTLIKDSFLQTLGFKVKDVDPKVQSQVNVAVDQAAEQVVQVDGSLQTPESKKQSYLQIITNMLARIKALFAPKSA